MKGMLLTAGLGTRLRPLTNKFAKPAVPFLGVPLLHYPLWLMRACGVTDVVMNSHYLPEQIAALASTIGAHVSHEPTILGSGGGIWKAKAWLEDSDSFMVSNGDEVILPHDPSVLSRFVSEHHSNDALATILVMKHPLVGTQFGGVWCSPSGDVRGFGKVGADFGADAIGYHYIGLLLMNQRVFSFMPEGESNILYDVLKSAIAAGEKVRVVVSEFTWFETGNPHDFLSATREGLGLLWCARDGVSFATSVLKDSGLRNAARVLKELTSACWSAGTKLDRIGSALVLRAPGATVDAGVSIEGFAVLEAGARLRATSSNVVLMPGASVDTPKQNEICL